MIMQNKQERITFFQLAHDLVTSLYFYSGTLWCIFWLQTKREENIYVALLAK